jgi:hypothetical protein
MQRLAAADGVPIAWALVDADQENQRGRDEAREHRARMRGEAGDD